MIEHDSHYKDQSHLTFEERIKTNYDASFAFDTDWMIAQINELLEGRRWIISRKLMTMRNIRAARYRQEPQDIFHRGRNLSS